MKTEPVRVKRVRLPDRPHLLVAGRVRDQVFRPMMSALEAVRCDTVEDLPRNGVLVLGSGAGKKKLVAAKARCPELTALSLDEFLEVDLRPSLLRFLQTESNAWWTSRIPERVYDLRDADLRGLTIRFGRQADVSGSDLTGATVKGCNLIAHGTNFAEATLDDCRVEGSGANFRDATLKRSYLTVDQADMQRAEVAYGFLTATDTDFTSATLTRLQSTRITRGTLTQTRSVDIAGWFWECDLSDLIRLGEGFEHVTSQVKMTDCRIADVATNERLDGEFTDCTFERFRGVLAPAQLDRCRFVDCQLSGSLFAGLDLASCTFTDTSLRGSCCFANTPLPQPASFETPDGSEHTFRGPHFRIDGGGEVELRGRGFSSIEVAVSFGVSRREILVDAQVAASCLRDAGAQLLSVPESEADRTYWTSVTGSSSSAGPAVDPAREAEFVRLLREDYHNDALWTVFADFLMEGGDPRGHQLRHLLNGLAPPKSFHALDVLGLTLEMRRLFVWSVLVTSTSLRKSCIAPLFDDPRLALLRSVDYRSFSPQARHLVERFPIRAVFANGYARRVIDSLRQPAEHVRTFAVANLEGTEKKLRDLFPNLQLVAVRGQSSDERRTTDLEVETLTFSPRRISYLAPATPTDVFERVRVRRLGIGLHLELAGDELQRLLVWTQSALSQIDGVEEVFFFSESLNECRWMNTSEEQLTRVKSAPSVPGLEELTLTARNHDAFFVTLPDALRDVVRNAGATLIEPPTETS